MSRVDTDGRRLILPEVARVRRLPNQHYHELETNSTRSSRDSNKTIQHQMDELDGGCVVTGVHRHTDVMAHLLNAQRGDADAKIEVV
jgi:hypothetical protein